MGKLIHRTGSAARPGAEKDTAALATSGRRSAARPGGASPDDAAQRGLHCGRMAGGRPLAVFSSVHFLVDFCCILLLTAFVVPLAENRLVWIGCVVIYNLFAFAGQLPIGAFGDLYGRPARLSAFGCGLIAGAYAILWIVLLFSGTADPVSVSGPAAQGSSAMNGSSTAAAGEAGMNYLLFAVCITAGIGNACFHVGGGIDTLKSSEGRASRPGIFVSTGAFGVFLAPVLAARHPGLTAEVLTGILPMFCSCAALLRLDRRSLRPERSSAEKDRCFAEEGRCFAEPDSDRPPAEPEPVPRSYGPQPARLSYPERRRYPGWAAALLCLFLTISLRSYAGGLMGFPWKTGFLPGLLFTAGVAGGKMAGGILGDRIGWMKCAAGSLLLALGLFFPADDSALCGITGVFFFNMTMPLTLTASAVLAGRGREGTAFGLTTCALFLGTLPSVAGQLLNVNVSPAWMLAAVTILSVPLVCIGIAGAAGRKSS